MNSKPQKNHVRERAVIYLMTFIMGGCGIAYEYTFSKISGDLLGNSVHQWAITIGLMMFFMGIGSDLQKHISDKALFDKFIYFELLLGVIGAFGPVALLYSFGYFRDHYVLVQYGATVSVGFLIGLEIPILTRINEEFAPELKMNIGGILRMDYVGAFGGALAWVFILPRFFTLTQMSFVLGILNLTCALLALLWFYRLAHRKILTGVLTLVSLGAIIFGLTRAPDWTSHAEQRLFADKIIYSASTRYQHIVLTESAAGEIYCYINGNTQFSSYDEHIYHEMLVHPAMLMAPKRDRVLILGGGDGLALREVLKYPDAGEITLVDLDPGMTKMAAEQETLVKLNHGAFQNARVKVIENGALKESDETMQIYIRNQNKPFQQEEKQVAEVNLINMDASLFIDQIRGAYDVIILDFPDPNNLELSKLYSKTFYTQLRHKLARDGVLVQQSTSPVFSKEAFLCIGRTLKDSGFNVLPYHEHVPTFGEWGFWIASRDDNPALVDLDGAMRRIDDIPVPVNYMTPDLIDASLAFGKGMLDTREESVNTLVNNVIFRYYADALTY